MQIFRITIIIIESVKPAETPLYVQGGGHMSFMASCFIYHHKSSAALLSSTFDIL